MKKSKAKKCPARPSGDFEELAESYAFEYRLHELMLTCERVGLQMSDGMVFEVWGTLRSASHLGWVRLGAAQGDARAAVAEAHRAAEELQRPYLKTVTREMVAEAARELMGRQGGGADTRTAAEKAAEARAADMRQQIEQGGRSLPYN